MITNVKHMNRRFELLSDFDGIVTYTLVTLRGKWAILEDRNGDTRQVRWEWLMWAINEGHAKEVL